MVNCITHNSSNLPTRLQLENETALSPAETKAHEILEKVRGGSLYARVIRNTIRGGSNAAFRKLIKELKEQHRDAPAELKNIIGLDGIRAIKDC